MSITQGRKLVEHSSRFTEKGDTYDNVSTYNLIRRYDERGRIA
jgi:hypothetical protein